MCKEKRNSWCNIWAFLQEEVEKEISYDVLLERQKILLLTRREIEDWKRIVYGEYLG